MSEDPSSRSQAALRRIAGPSKVLSVVCLVFAAVMAALTLLIGVTPLGDITIVTRDGAVADFSIALGNGVTTGTSRPAQAEAVTTVMAVSDLGGPARAALFAWVAVPTAFLVWGLIGAWRCFRGLGRGAFFARDTIVGLRTFAWAVFLYVFTQPVMKMLAGPFLPAPEGERALNIEIALNGDSAIMLIFSGAVILVSHALARAAEIAEENEQFI